MRTPSAVSDSTSTSPSGAVASRSRAVSKPSRCSSCWSVELVGSQSADPPVGHRVERVGRTDPLMLDHLVAFERGARAGGQLRGEEPGVEPSWIGRRRHPARERDQQVRPKRQVELLRKRREPDLPTDQGRSGRAETRPGTETSAAGHVRQEHPGLLERFADGGDEGGDRRRGGRSPPSATAASAGESVDRAMSAGSASAGSTRPPGKTCMSGANAIDAGRRPRSTSRPRRPGRRSTTVAAGRGTDRRRGRHLVAAASSARSASGSVTGSRHTKSRQT